MIRCSCRCCVGVAGFERGGMRRAGNIILVGFMGSGKTTVGKVLARKLGWRFLDLDREIEKAEGMSVREIFRKRGESAFRDLEHRAIRSLSKKSRSVIAAGGGAPVFSRNRVWLKRAGRLVYLNVPVTVLVERLKGVKDRPLLASAGGRKKALMRLISAILNAREAHYRRADIVVNVGRSSVVDTVRKVECGIFIDRCGRRNHGL